MENNYMSTWKRNSIRIGTPTNLLAALTAFIPVIYLCVTYPLSKLVGLLEKKLSGESSYRSHKKKAQAKA